MDARGEPLATIALDNEGGGGVGQGRAGQEGQGGEGGKELGIGGGRGG